VPGKRCTLAGRRRMVGYTQEQLAAVLGVERTTVVRWEAGGTCPQPWCRPKLARALDVSVEELDTMLAGDQAVEDERSQNSSEPRDNGHLCDGDAAEEPQDDLDRDPVLVAPWNHRGTVDAVVLLSGGDRVKRREFEFLAGAALTAPAHQWLVHEPEPLVLGLSGRRISAGMVHQFTAMIAELRKMDDVAGGGSVLALAQHEFGWVAGLLDQARYDERTGRMLFVALAELGQLCGWAAYDAGQHALAQRYYVAALRATHSADDRPLGAHVLSLMAEQAARQGQPAEAVTLIQTALAGTRGRQTPSLLAELYTGQAYAFATLGDASGCTAALSQARTQIERLTPAAEPSWLYWVNPATMTSDVGSALRQLGHAEQAATMLENGIAMFDDSLPRGQAGYLVALADVRSRPGKQRDLDVAASHGMEAIRLTETLDSPRLAGLIRNLYHQMTPHAAVSAVGDFLERARSLVTV
jgi:DNA-binding XRE family transcriptional regulator/tetratricopeptide (TPR) repeat protein